MTWLSMSALPSRLPNRANRRRDEVLSFLTHSSAFRLGPNSRSSASGRSGESCSSDGRTSQACSGTISGGTSSGAGGRPPSQDGDGSSRPSQLLSRGLA